MNNWPLWEIFIRSKSGLQHRHVGSLHAVDHNMAIQNARDIYCRRNEGISIWVVKSDNVYATHPEDHDELFEPAQNKIYRHPTFYKLPEELKNM